ncbi:MAG: ABC transporter permease [Synergistaceae bacterium]|jgi:ABC-type nitrate/sulfonate/bicarbonate transport system permease component|nr:ABC transporter permease [Synergistaceae bacterium]
MTEDKKTKLRRYVENLYPPLLTLVFLLVGWECIVRTFHVSKVVLPPPSDIIRETTRYFSSDILPGWLVTVRTMSVGYLSGVPAGIILASVMSQSRFLIKALVPYIVLLVTLPMMVVVPIFMVWAGYDVKYRAILSFVQVTAIIALNTLSGFRNISQSKLDLAAGYGATRLQTFLKVIFPNALPEVFQGLRLGCTFSILNAIGIEFIAGKIGMGFSVQYFSSMLKTAIAFGCIFTVGLTGRLMFMIVEILQKLIVTWER